MAGLALEVCGAIVRYGSRTAVKGADLALPFGRITALLGGNGAGKTSLLKACAGLLAMAGGRITAGGRPLADLSARQRARLVAYLPQSHRAIFSYSVNDVVLMGRWCRSSVLGGYDRADHRAAERAMERVGIAHLAERPYTELSGGERQLVLVARALAQDGQILVLDEPETGLDFGYRLRLMGVLAELADAGQAVLLSSHFPDNVLWFAGQAVLMAEGRIIAAGEPAQVVTAERLRTLYGVEVRLETTPQGRPVCVPASG